MHGQNGGESQNAAPKCKTATPSGCRFDSRKRFVRK
jgi:hypothetical protein